jgi:N-acetylmuramoyl-L-alanine amidase
MTKIYLDAGHGGTDSGAVGNGLFEKNLTLSITKKIEEILQTDFENVEIMTTRDTDIFLSLTERTDKANKWGADIFVAVHINASTGANASGFQSHIYTKADAKTIAMQNVMHAAIYNSIKSFKIADRGKDMSNFHVLRESKMIAILTENGFISSPFDSSLLKNEDYLNKVAQGHVDGLEKYFGLKRKEKTQDSPSEPTGTLYQVVAGTFKDRNHADEQVKKLKADGYEAYIKML